MRFSTVAAAAALVAGASASYGNYSAPVYVTEVVSSYVTYCSAATELTYGTETYTVTEPTYVTVTNCPCTVVKPYISSVVTSCASSTPAPYSTPVYTPGPYTNGTTSASPVYPTGTSAPSGTTAVYPTFTGAANKAFAASGAGLAAVFGLVAYVL